VVDANTCRTTCTGSLTNFPSPSCSITPANALLCPGDCTNFTVTATGGRAPYSFRWSRSPIALSPDPGNVSTLPNQCAVAGITYNYTVVVTDANGCTNTCTATLRPDVCGGALKVYKQVVCYLPNTCEPFNPDLNTQKLARGAYTDNQFPAFCYRYQVCNVSNTPVRITSITDTHPDGTPTSVNSRFGECAGALPLAVGTVLQPGECTTFCVISPVEIRENTINIVTVNGVVTTSGQAVPETKDTNRVEIIPFDVACEKEVSLDNVTWDTKVEVPFNATTPVFYRVTVSTTRSLPLVVTINDENFNCPPITVNLSPGTPVTVSLCGGQAIMITCPPSPSNNTVTVSAVVDTTRTNICVTTKTNTTVTATSECVAAVMCSPPEACRVTGGGRQDDPIVCPDADVRYVTHGGQVGAPVGQDTCSIDTTLPNWQLGNPCIHGRWTHVRHKKGGLRGNFHARFYDTLTCACLETNVNADCSYDLLAPIGDLCGDRSTGPQPRKAPANKITFTGVGDWTCEPGHRRPRACLFRVDIEDRGEPGNAHALDSNGKPNRVPDRYRIRIWVLTEDEEARLRNPADGLLAFRNAISACNGINFRDGGASGTGAGCDVNNCNGNICPGEDTSTVGLIRFPAPPNGGALPDQVRTPNIDDGGELLHGNHQIHPQIKNCDPHNPTGPGLAKP